MIDLNQYQKKILSQYGQDGVLDKIFETIGTTNKYFVEFGSSGNDSGQGNTAQLRRKGFDGLLMDGSERPYNNDINDKKYEVKIEFVSSSNINQLFEKYNVPEEFDFLSIDIDGQDFHVWQAINAKYKPRVVSVEMNHHIDPGIDIVMNKDDNFVWAGYAFFGAGITALKKLGIKKGYALVATCMSDAIFVRNDLLCKDNKILFTNINNEYELYRLDKDIAIDNLKFTTRDWIYQHPMFIKSDFYLYDPMVPLYYY